ncbi:hypothetical protein C1645_744453 [Glomus cerebriforme]|uniref:Uncharacterized protein n=1 Tax=Glomus cerebriforme TaxID=658196 RepID=A0A397S7T2_9GLOM|nr:hypothetical protein C1645_744453 [Glomus cerebriforme]
MCNLTVGEYLKNLAFSQVQKLRDIQKELYSKYYVIIKPEDTRWNSYYDCFKSLIRTKQVLRNLTTQYEPLESGIAFSLSRILHPKYQINKFNSDLKTVNFAIMKKWLSYYYKTWSSSKPTKLLAEFESYQENEEIVNIESQDDVRRMLEDLQDATSNYITTEQDWNDRLEKRNELLMEEQRS